MAREERDREDLLREATALVQRVELQLPLASDSVVIGFRRSGAASIYWGQDEVYHFNASNELRRGYLKGRLVKAEQGRLFWLVRHRDAGQSQLIKNEMSDDEQRGYLSVLADRFETLRRCFVASDFTVVGQVPEDGDVVERCIRWLTDLRGPLVIARRPGLKESGGKQ